MKAPKKNWLEWLIFGSSTVIVAFTLGYLVHAALTNKNQPAQLSIELGKSEAREAHFAVPIRVANTGDESAEQVRIEVLLTTNDGKDERAEIDFAFVPRHGNREGWVTFLNDPSQASKLSARPLGYEKP